MHVRGRYSTGRGWDGTFPMNLLGAGDTLQRLPDLGCQIAPSLGCTYTRTHAHPSLVEVK
jgi:hypothetical protein